MDRNEVEGVFVGSFGLRALIYYRFAIDVLEGHLHIPTGWLWIYKKNHNFQETQDSRLLFL